MWQKIVKWSYAEIKMITCEENSFLRRLNALSSKYVMVVPESIMIPPEPSLLSENVDFLMANWVSPTDIPFNER